MNPAIALAFILGIAFAICLVGYLAEHDFNKLMRKPRTPKPSLKPHATPFSQFSAKPKPTMNPHPTTLVYRWAHFNPDQNMQAHNKKHPDCWADWEHAHEEWL